MFNSIELKRQVLQKRRLPPSPPSTKPFHGRMLVTVGGVLLEAGGRGS